MSQVTQEISLTKGVTGMQPQKDLGSMFTGNRNLGAVNHYRG